MGVVISSLQLVDRGNFGSVALQGSSRVLLVLLDGGDVVHARVWLQC